MNFEFVISELERNITVFKSLLENTPVDLVKWKPEKDKWSLLEIICHLCDEEREDFRQRVQHVLETPVNLMPAIDPVAWVTSRKYMEQDFNRKLNEFAAEREKSILWLKQLKDPNWENIYKHPKVGDLKAELFFVNWLAHDYLHIRQITKNKYLYLKQSTGETLDYAGEW